MKKNWLSKPTSILVKNSHSETGVAFDFEMYFLVGHSMAFPQGNTLCQCVSSSAAHAITLMSYNLAFVMYKRKQSWQSGRKKEKSNSWESKSTDLVLLMFIIWGNNWQDHLSWECRIVKGKTQLYRLIWAKCTNFFIVLIILKDKFAKHITLKEVNPCCCKSYPQVPHLPFCSSFSPLP